MKSLPSIVFAVGIATSSSACIFSSGSDDPFPGGGRGGSPDGAAPECYEDWDCHGAGASEPCRENKCVNGACTVQNVPEGVTPQTNGDLVCRRLICDGQGNEKTLIDPTAVKDTPHDCKQTACDAQGNPSYTPNTSDLPEDVAGDCKKPACAANGTPSTTPSPSDIPANVVGDCKKPACTADGLPSTTNDDSDPPPPGACMAYTCSNGAAAGHPINQGKNCSSYGFTCGTTGYCDTCPPADAQCTDPGPGKNSRTPNTAYAFDDIGRCDSGGRTFCGALPAGQTAYFSFRDDGTGFLCEHDPYISVSPSAPVTLCVGNQCTDTGSMSFDTAEGSTYVISVTAKTGCTSYELSFHL